jgi:hypothetical protein
MADETQTGSSEELVILDDFGDAFTADLVAAKLRAFGIQAQAQPATARGGIRLPAGNIVWVFASDLQDAQAIVAED